MLHRIETFTKPNFNDVHGHEIKNEIRQLGVNTIDLVQSIRVTLIDADLQPDELNRIARELLTDPVSEDYLIGQAAAPPGIAKTTIFEVHLKPGVTDPVAASTTLAITDMRLAVNAVRTARKYLILGSLNDKQKKLIAQNILANDCIEQVIIDQDSSPPSGHLEPYQLKILTLPLENLDSDALLKLSSDRDLFLNLAEMQTIQKYYKTLDRDPTDIELESLAQTWSEHCIHKTFKHNIEFTDASADQPNPVLIENLLKSTIARATFELDKPWCISVFKDNAGIIEFDDEFAITFKAETHNHPSAIEPYGGAATGIGGCIRDTLGTGLAAKPIASTDVFCVAPPDKSMADLPEGVLHPRRVLKGVIAGVRDYGNRMGIPTVNGAIFFDDRYLANPLVFCGNIGLIPKDKAFDKDLTGTLIMVVGGRTGRDGIHGATFSSGQMTHEHETLFSHAVQIGNPITEKKVTDTLIKARDKNLYVAITDCGAGGLSSAVGEMAQESGATVNLEKVPLKYQGLSYTEIWISEAQERMVIAVPPENLQPIQKIFDDEDVEATVIGTFDHTKKLCLRYNDKTVGTLDMEFLHDGLPKLTRKAVWNKPDRQEPDLPQKQDYTEDLKTLLAHYNLASKEWVIRQYDHEVQAGSVLKPLVGIDNDAPGDAAVIRPRLNSDRAIAIGCGICPQYSDIDPYAMAVAAIDEALRNIIAVGADPEKIAILDNFCWGNCDHPDTLGALVKAAQGCYDAAIAFGTPFISGKDSLNNEFQTADGHTISIPHTLLISAVGIVEDANQCVSMDAKQPGNIILILGLTKNELGASHYYKIHNQLGANVPRVDLKAAAATFKALAQAIRQRLVRSCHDCSEGGLAVACAEMAFAGNLGMDLHLHTTPLDKTITRNDQILFSESPSRFIVEIEPQNLGRFARLCSNIRFAQIGKITNDSRLTIKDPQHKTIIDADIDDLKNAWKKTFQW